MVKAIDGLNINGCWGHFDLDAVLDGDDLWIFIVCGFEIDLAVRTQGQGIEIGMGFEGDRILEDKGMVAILLVGIVGHH